MSKRTDMQSLHILNHSKCMLAAFHNLRQDESMLDVTLACQGLNLKAHKLILSACSPFFKSVLENNPCKHPIIILKDVEFVDLKAVIDFLYKGELSVPRERLIPTLKVAEDLQIRGLTRHESNKVDYEKLYQKVHERQSGRKRRKKYRKCSSDSEGQDYSNNSDSDEIVSQSDDSEIKTLEKTEANLSPSCLKDQGSHDESSDEAGEPRPVVLRVTEPADNEALSANKDDMEVENISDQPFNAFQNHDLDENDSNQNDVIADEEIHDAPVSVQENSPVQEHASVCVPEPSVSASHGNIEDSNSVIPLVEVDHDNVQAKISGMETGAVGGSSTVDEGTDSVKQVSVELNSSSPAMKSQSIMPSEQADSESETEYGNENLDGFECSTCGLLLNSRSALIRHEIIIHKSHSMIRPLKCNYCSFTTRQIRRLKNHMLMHCKNRFRMTL